MFSQAHAFIVRLAARGRLIPGWQSARAHVMHPRLVIGIVLAVAALFFVFQNIGVIEIRFLFWSITMSRSLLLFLVLLIGVVIGWLWHSVSLRRAARREETGPVR